MCGLSANAVVLDPEDASRSTWHFRNAGDVGQESAGSQVPKRAFGFVSAGESTIFFLSSIKKG